MIEVEHLSKRYGSFEAVKDISFRVDEGEVVGFLGPNGAGKSTTLRIMAGFIGASAGRVRVAGFDIADEPLRAREKLGYMPETAPLYPEMRVVEYLAYRAELKRVDARARAAAVARVIEDAGLVGFERVLIGQLSKGYRQRVGLADALVASPPLLILDEPTAGLDPNQIREVRDLVRRLSKKHTIFLSTHILSEVEAVCTRGIVIARGELVAAGSIDALRASRRPRAVRMRLRTDIQKARAVAAAVAGVESATAEEHETGSTVVLTAAFDDPDTGEAITERLVAAFVGASIGILEVVPQSSLEDVFAELTRPTEDGRAA